jgi:chemotaxis protein histidine kinase CheA
MSRAAHKVINGYAALINTTRHTAIKLGETNRHVLLIPFDSAGLQVIKISHDQFAAEWAEFPYPVEKAARSYLESYVAQSSTTSSEARDCLERILSSESQVPSTSLKENTMATAKKTAAKKTTTTAKAAAKKPTASKAAAKKPAVTAKAATPAKAAAKKPALSGNFKVGDDSSVKRGFLRDFVDAAKALKTFTRDQLVAKFKSKEEEERLVRYFGYSVKHDIFKSA